MNQCNELAGVIHEALCQKDCRDSPETWPRIVFELTDAVLSAGFRKPAT